MGLQIFVSHTLLCKKKKVEDTSFPSSAHSSLSRALFSLSFTSADSITPVPTPSSRNKTADHIVLQRLIICSDDSWLHNEWCLVSDYIPDIFLLSVASVPRRPIFKCHIFPELSRPRCVPREGMSVWPQHIKKKKSEWKPRCLFWSSASEVVVEKIKKLLQ